ncbi:hypothetical protein GGX14DRAFT_384337 [Mycena pura]|uniref:Uncharacterized protein n=1 Tax=Mycena pura TaxID=153505 RepID=A0AAD6YVH5_9AGAR|nr:hypothetical protein GGX14DRAFT_384337 [Mycena pura]
MGAGGAGVRGHMISALQAVAASEGFRWVVLEVVTTHRNPSDRGHWAWDSEVIWGNKTKNTIFAPAQTACRVALMGGVELGWMCRRKKKIRTEVLGSRGRTEVLGSRGKILPWLYAQRPQWN